MGPPRAFMPFTIGNDICSVPRIISILRHPDKGPRFIRRILAPEEIQGSWASNLLKVILNPPPRSFKQGPPRLPRDEEPSYDLLKASRFMAGRFAAKEAVVKAHPYRNLTWHRIVIARLEIRPAPKTITGPLASGPLGLLREPVPTDERPEEVAAAAAAAEEEGGDKGEERQPQEQDGAAPDKKTGMYFSGPPIAIIKGDKNTEDIHVSVSISHDGDYASAVCLGYYEWSHKKAGGA